MEPYPRWPNKLGKLDPIVLQAVQANWHHEVPRQGTQVVTIGSCRCNTDGAKLSLSCLALVSLSMALMLFMAETAIGKTAAWGVPCSFAMAASCNGMAFSVTLV